MAQPQATLAGTDLNHPAGRYSAPARFFHWSIAFLMLVVWPAGLIIDRFYEVEWAKNTLYFIHENLGVTIWLLALARLAWRFISPPPPLPADTPAVIRGVAHATHWALYAILLAQPIGGFIATNAWGFPLTFFGLIPLPDPVGNNEALAKAISNLHWLTGLALLGLLTAHVAGALFHLVVKKDGIFQRMT
jgi:cytochrome b561